MKRNTIFHGIYPVITEKFCLNGSSIKTLKAALKGGAKIIQLREKEYPKKKIYEMALEFRRLTSKAGAMLIINDHADIAAAVKADGVHLGQDDLPIEAVKKAAPGLLIGASTHNLKEALKAEKEGADYINIGPVFSTATKEKLCAPLGPETVKKIAEKIKIPFTVMGGIKKENIKTLQNTGARCIAVVTAVTGAKNPEREVREILKAIKN